MNRHFSDLVLEMPVQETVMRGSSRPLRWLRVLYRGI